jgi:hypothetical protein
LIVYLSFSYPPKYIDEQFKNFFSKNLVPFPLLQLSCSIIYEDDFQSLHERLLQTRTLLQSKRFKRIQKPKLTTEQRELENEKYEEIAKTRLIIHIMHEKRLSSLKNDINQIWSQSFTGSSLESIRFIVGNRHRRNSKQELVDNRTRPPIKKLRTAASEYNVLPFIIISEVIRNSTISSLVTTARNNLTTA